MTTVVPRLVLGFVLVAAAPGTPYAANDGVPDFDVTPSCRTGVKEGVRNDIQTCIDSEKNARAQPVKQWSDFLAADRTLCTKASSMGGSATYTELITCLEMRRDVRVLNQNQRMARDADAKR